MPESRVPSLLKLSTNRLGELTAGADGPPWVARVVADPVACHIAKNECDSMEARQRIRLADPNEESLAGAMEDFGAALREPAAPAVRRALAHNALQVACVYTPRSNVFDVRQQLATCRLNVALEPRAASLAAGVVGTLALHRRVRTVRHADAVMHGKLAWRRRDNSLRGADLGALVRRCNSPRAYGLVRGAVNLLGGLSASLERWVADKAGEALGSILVGAAAQFSNVPDDLPATLPELETWALAEAHRASASWMVSQPVTRITCQIAAQPRAAAVACLQRLQDKRPAADAMTAMLAPAWAMLGGAEGYAALSRMAQGTVKDRLAAAKALRDLREPSPNALLERLAEDDDLDVFEAAVAALQSFDAQDPALWRCIHAAATSQDWGKRASVVDMYANAATTRPDALQQLSNMASDSGVLVRERIAQRIGHLNMPEAFSILRQWATDPACSVAHPALTALITTPSEVDFALEAAEPLRLHPNAVSRHAAAMVYAAGGQRAALQKLLTLVGPQNPAVDAIAAEYLVRLGGPQAAEKLAMLFATSQNYFTRHDALRGLSELGGDTAAAALEQEVRSPADPMARAPVPVHFAPAMTPFNAYFPADDVAKDGLLAAGGPRAVTWLREEIAAGRDLVRNIGRAKAFQDPALSADLQKLASHPDPAVRAALRQPVRLSAGEAEAELEVSV